jgi:hypothetical protein
VPQARTAPPAGRHDPPPERRLSAPKGLLPPGPPPSPRRRAPAGPCGGRRRAVARPGGAACAGHPTQPPWTPPAPSTRARTPYSGTSSRRPPIVPPRPAPASAPGRRSRHCRRPGTSGWRFLAGPSVTSSARGSRRPLYPGPARAAPTIRYRTPGRGTLAARGPRRRQWARASRLQAPSARAGRRQRLPELGRPGADVGPARAPGRHRPAPPGGAKQYLGRREALALDVKQGRRRRPPAHGSRRSSAGRPRDP